MVEHLYRTGRMDSGLGIAAAAPLLANYLYGEDAKTLMADEKTTISAITGLVGAGVGASTGNHTNIAQGAQSGQNAVEHNVLAAQQINKWVEEIKGCESKSSCDQIIDKYEQLSITQKEAIIYECANNPESCAQKYGHYITDSLLIKQALDNALGQQLPAKMAFDLTALFMQQREVEGVIASQAFAQELQERYGIDVADAQLAGQIAYSVISGVKGGTTISGTKGSTTLGQVDKIQNAKQIIFDKRQLDKKFKHASDFGIDTQKKNPQTLSQFELSLVSHLKAKNTVQNGTYGYVENSKVYFNKSTNNVVVLDKNDNFITGFKIYPGTPQFENLIKNGILR